MFKLVVCIFLGGIVLISAAQPQEGDVLPGYHNLKKLRPLGTEFAEYFHNVTLSDLEVRDPRLPSQQDLLCLRHMAQLTLSLASGEFWALKSE